MFQHIALVSLVSLLYIVAADVTNAVDRLVAALPGQVQTDGIPPPFNTRFDAANGYVPAAMVYVSSAEDIITALEICYDEGAPVALRSSSGHSFIGQSTVNGGIVINFMKLKAFGVALENGRFIAKLGSGLKLLEVYSRLARHDPPLGFAGGLRPSVGIAGLTSGGGYGFSSSKYGVAADRVVAAEVVVYNREEDKFELVTATGYNEHSDLLFAVRGGMGGNYGALVSLSYDAFPVTNVVVITGNEPLVDPSLQAQSIKAFQEFLHSDAAGPDIFGTARILGVGSINYNAQCLCDATGDCTTCHAKLDAMQAAVGLASPLRIEQDFGKAMWFWADCTADSGVDLYPPDGVGSFSEEELQEAMQKCLAFNAAVYSRPFKAKCMFFPQNISIEDLEFLVEAVTYPICKTPVDCMTLMHFQGHALLDEPQDCDQSAGKCTSFDHRKPGWLLEVYTAWERDEAAPADKLEWLQNSYDMVFPGSLGTSNQNCIDSDLAVGRDWIGQYFPNADTYPRLQQAKCRYNAIDMFNFEAVDLMTIDIDDSICGECTTATITAVSTTAEAPDDCVEADKKCSIKFPDSYCMTYKAPSVCWGSNEPCTCTPGPTPSSTTTEVAAGDDCHEEDLRCSTLNQGSYCMYWNDPSTCWGTSEPCGCN
ncbi:hypothetical protein FOZ61_001151 [Perkinsus olseni]|uniref:FAD-binding PCMH-type domain-containing protein n=1 Tax=Perkinsus olseni TaxID=32597 RepID=A0A7J6KRW7_PEROL|nr:hypothetical protein FOZ61_001151 [Perkinsus olseni]KAF4651360.1 hypothetical protein FOL46_000356 [Perkinsus olseni]